MLIVLLTNIFTESMSVNTAVDFFFFFFHGGRKGAVVIITLTRELKGIKRICLPGLLACDVNFEETLGLQLFPNSTNTDFPLK